MNANSTTWVRISLINLCIVATLGVLMRYKIGFEFPFLDQKHLQEAHSHFAFSGWISHTLYYLIINLFRNNLTSINEKIYGRLIFLNLFSAYGMLGSFIYQGYGPVSIFFSSLSILTGYVFAYFVLKDAGRLTSDHPSRNWIKASVLFSVLSTVGTFILSYMMATRHFDQSTYLGSIYFFLHFQYNGWFIFACMGLFMDKIKAFDVNRLYVRYSFILLFLAGIPAYFLSTLWAHLPLWLYCVVVFAAITQLIGWWFFTRIIWSNATKIKMLFPKPVQTLFLIILLALTLKLFLQLGSTVPAISKLAFGFRPIVIAYLHVVLLVIVSMFLLAFMYGTSLIKDTVKSKIPLLVFAGGAILNEIVLAIQGVAALSYIVIPHVNGLLFCIAVILLISVFFLMLAQFRTPTIDANHPLQ